MKAASKLHPKWIVCLALIAAALLCIFALPGYDFSGYCFLGLGSLIPVYHLLRKRKVLTMILNILLSVFLIAAAITWGVIAQSAQGAADAKSDYLIVLGAGVNGTTPSRTLRERLDAALDYLQDHPNAVAIVSGGMGDGENITEAQCMYNYLTEAGIDADRVWMEDRATNTIENLKYSLDIIQSRTGTRPTCVAIVSSEFHLHRTGLFAARLGLEAELIPAKTGIIPLRWNYYLREIIAVWYYSIIGG